MTWRGAEDSQLDHDHTIFSGRMTFSTNRHFQKSIRGVLCHNCNHGLGSFKDDVDMLYRARKGIVFPWQRRRKSAWS